MRCYASVVYAIIVCPCVCFCHMLVLYQNAAELGMMQTTPHDIPGTLLFSDAKDISEIRMGLPQMRATYAGAVDYNQ